MTTGEPVGSGRAGDAEPSAPSISLPKGGGAIRGMGETFSASSATGTGGVSIPIATSPPRSGLGPQLTLGYDSAAGNGPYGYGWGLEVPSVTRRTDRGVPRYRDADQGIAAGASGNADDNSDENDTFRLTGAEDLVRTRDEAGTPRPDDHLDGHTVRRFRPRIEGAFSRIERWTRDVDGDVHWRALSPANILSVYGRTDAARIRDPEDPRRVFSWLMCETRDDIGNAVMLDYKREDAAGVDLDAPHEVSRGGAAAPPRTAHRYLKRIRYGNQTPLLDAQGQRPVDVPPAALAAAGWMFEVVFDYGEHDPVAPTPGDTGTWVARDDPFSSYRAGFEVRTYRLCRRILMFHNFPDEPGIGQDCLVGSLDLDYTASAAGSCLASLTRHGYIRQQVGYSQAAMPPLNFGYTTAVVDPTVHRLSPESRENLPGSIGTTPGHQWADLDGEGLTGVLMESAGAWYYTRNDGIPAGGVTGNGTVKLGPLRPVDVLPALADLGGGAQQLLDVDADGRMDLVQFAREPAGFHRRTNAGWDNFTPFPDLPLIDWNSPTLRFVDLTGDGRADLLVTEDEASTWHPSLGAHGYGPALPVPAFETGDTRPQLLLAGRSEGVFLADMSGDGLADLVRVRNGEVAYWPSLGYGRFGAKVVMDGAPVLDRPDAFDPSRLRLADADGSGTTDLIYLGPRQTVLWFNRSGNGWGPPQPLPALPHQADLPAGNLGVQVIDLLGNGTACLVWSSPLPAGADDPVRYVDLMGGQKPHLLDTVTNNLGAQTRVRYAPSTKFYLADRRAGRPWITRLPFPVHVVERVDQLDHIARTRFSSTYAYHHGFYDGVEREFRGFAMVEQTDTENFDDYLAGVQEAFGTGPGGAQDLSPDLYQPPVTTRSWFHTGAWLGADRIGHQLRREYHPEDPSEPHLPEPVLPQGMDEEETHQCLRALKGVPLRQETYSFDGSPQAGLPYAVSENAYQVRRLQPRVGDAPAVFHVIGAQTLTRTYERNLTDPRVQHTVLLEVGPFGNSVASATITYGRRIADPALPAEVTRDQQRAYLTYGESEYTPLIDQVGPVPAYRVPVPFETRAYEVTGVRPIGAIFTARELHDGIATAADIGYEIVADNVAKQRRLLSRSRTQFRDNTLTPLGRGLWDTLALGYRNYRLAFTPGVVAAHYAGEIDEAAWTAAGFVHLDGDANRWVPSGIANYPANPATQFYRSTGATDPLGLETTVSYDRYGLLPERIRVRQAPWNDVSAVNDYRVLSPVLLTDVNRNRSAVAYDALGMVTRSAVMGKEGAGEGDTLADPTVRMEYELFNWVDSGKPNFVHTFSRTQHGAANTRWQESYTYSNGAGGVAMAKSQAPPGKALRPNPDGTATEVDADPRWLGTGRTVVNNKGNPVRQYEPFFSTTHEYEPEEALRAIGTSPVVHHDPLGRVVRTDGQNGTFTTSSFDAWRRVDADANDTVRDSRWYAERGSPDPTGPEPLTDPERRAAWLAARHAGTTSAMHLDSLGRPIYTVADRGDVTTTVRSESDLTGRYTRMFDQRGRQVADGFAGMTGVPVHVEGAEKGGRATFVNVLGGMVRTWDDFGRTFRAEYDVMHRPVSTYAKEPGQPEHLLYHVVYGDLRADAADHNLLGVSMQVFDPSGALRVREIDFQGNPTSVERVLARDHTQAPDWQVLVGAADDAAVQAAAAPLLVTAEPFVAGSEYDALNRPTRLTVHGGTVMEPSYDEANCLSGLQVQIEGSGPFVEFLKGQECDAKGQRLHVRHGNDVLVSYLYDPDTFRLTDLVAVHDGEDSVTAALQRVHYTYDPVGNVTAIRDDAQQTHFFSNAVVKPECRYAYDALYQLASASGREQAALTNATIRDSHDLDPIPQLPHVNDTAAVREYSESYSYDVLGNILLHRHVATVGGGSWTRRYSYTYQDDPGDATNRLHSTSRPGDPDAGPFTATYDYDAYGNMSRLNLPTPGELTWNVLDQLSRVDLGGGGTAFYVYGLAGQRIRKVIDRVGGTRVERIYLGPLEIYRERAAGGGLRLERHTLHIADNAGRIAQVDIKLRDEDNTDPANPIGTPLVRYQYGNLLGSATLETDAAGTVISYEEYHPYGTTAYRSGKPGVDLSLKRYRFSGKERDHETGLYYFGARYYAPWLGRWTSPDPAGFASGANLYRYCANNPVMMRDANGTDETHITARADPATSRRLNQSGANPVEVLHYFKTHGHPELTEAQVPSWDATKGRWLFPAAPAPAAATDPSSTGSGGTEPSQPTPTPLPTQAAATSVREAARPTAAAVPDPVARTRVGSPSTFAPGEPLQGPYNLWSNEAGGGLLEAADAPGFIMEDTTLEEAAEAAARRMGYTGRYDPSISRSDFNEIWHPTSDALATRAGLSQIGVESHGIDPASVARNPGYNPAGSVQVTREIPRVGVAGGAMTGLGLLSGILVLVGASTIRNSSVRTFGYVAGAGEVAGALRYGQGLLMLLGRLPGSAAVMTQGSLLGRFAGGAGAVVLSTYSLVNHLEEGNYGVTLGDSAGIVGGVAVLAGSGPVAAIAGGVAITNYAGDWVETHVTAATGSRTAGVGAGTLAGAGVGAGIGAGIGVWFFGVGAAPGAVIGGAIGGIAGFIGSYW